jgi:hypothetical protein
MNIAMEQTEEYVNGSVTNRYGDTFIRGNNGASLASVDLVAFLNPGQCCISLLLNLCNEIRSSKGLLNLTANRPRV